MNKFSCLFILVLALVITRYTLAQQSPAISGFIETTYNYNFAKGSVNSLRSYDYRSNQILLNNAHIAVTGAPTEKLSYDAELDFGTDATVHGLLNQGIFATGKQIGVDIQEAYFTYSFSNMIKFTGGKFVTFEGIELIEGPSNPTISRGYLYGLAEPFCHVGGYFTFLFNDKLDLRLGVINGWDKLVDNNRDKTIISRLGINLGDPFTVGISFYTGVEQDSSNNWRKSLDFTGLTKIIPDVALNFQANYGAETFSDSSGHYTNTKWYGFTIQPVINLLTNIDLGLRAEYFVDNNGVRSGISGLKSFNFTIVPSFKANNFLFRTEYRLDNSNKQIFVEENGTSKNSNTISFEVACIF